MKAFYSTFTPSWSHNFMWPYVFKQLFCRFWKMGGTHEVKRLSDTPRGKFHYSGQHLSWNHLCITCRITLIAFLPVICILNCFLKIPLESAQVEELRELRGSCLPCPQLMAQVVITILFRAKLPSSQLPSSPRKYSEDETPPLTTEKELCYVR